MNHESLHGTADRDQLTALRDAVARADADEIAGILGSDPSVSLLGDPELLSTALRMIPADAVERHPVLRLMAPLYEVVFNQPAQLGAPHPAQVPDPEVTPAQRELIVFMQLLAYRRRGEFDHAMASADRLRSLLTAAARTHGGEQTDRLPLYYVHLGLTSILLGDTAQAVADLALAAHAASTASTVPAIRRAIAAKTALAHALRGSAEDSLRILQDADGFADDLPLYYAHTEQAVRQLIAVDAMSEISEAPRILTPAELADELWPVSMLIQGRRALALGRPSVALEVADLATSAHRVEPSSLAADVAASLAIDAFLLLGEPSGARTVLDGLPSLKPLTRLARARYLMSIGETAPALRQCRKLLTSEPTILAVRGETLLLSLWIENQTGGRIQPTAAQSAAHLATGSGMRRIFTTVPESLIASIREAVPAETRRALDEALTGLTLRPELPVRPRLSERESAVLAAIIRHGTVNATAAALFVSANTVKTQLSAIYRKLGVNSREEAISVADRFDLTASSGADDDQLDG